MKSSFFLIFAAFSSLTAFAANYNLPAGASITLGADTVSCGAAVSSQILVSCLCYNTGRTDNPPPSRISFTVDSINDIDQVGRQQCSRHNYGDPSFGFSPVDDCHPAR